MQGQRWADKNLEASKESWCQAPGLFLGGQAALEMFCRNQRAMANHSCPGNTQWAPWELSLKTVGVRFRCGVPASAPGLDQARTQCCPHLACPECSIHSGLERRASKTGRALLFRLRPEPVCVKPHLALGSWGLCG